MTLDPPLVLLLLTGLAKALAPSNGKKNGNGGKPAEKKESGTPAPAPPPKGYVPRWARAVPSGGEVPIKNTWTGTPNDWRIDRYKRALAFLKSQGVANAREVALSAVAHWDLETAAGAHEYNFNVGGINATKGQQYFVSTDVGSPTVKVAFCAYDNIDQGIADYFAVLALVRYAGCLEMLLKMPASEDWIRCLGPAGYYGQSPAVVGPSWLARRKAIEALTGGASTEQSTPAPTPAPAPQGKSYTVPSGVYSVTGSNVNVRSSPASSGDGSPGNRGNVLMQTGPAEQAFQVDGQGEGEWIHGTFTVTGWIASQFLKGSSITGSDVNIRKDPSTSGTILARSGAAGQAFVADGKQQSTWSHGTYSQTGWVSQKYLKRGAPEPEGERAPPPRAP